MRFPSSKPSGVIPSPNECWNSLRLPQPSLEMLEFVGGEAPEEELELLGAGC